MQTAALFLLVAACTPTSTWRVSVAPVHRAAASRPAARAQRSIQMSLPSDEELFASLRSRIGQAEAGGAADSASGAPPPVGPDEVAADCMGPSDVVEYCMRSLLAKQGDDASEAARVLMAFAIKVTEGKAEDFVGQLQPGYFSDPATLCKYLSGQPRYETLTRMEEYKCMGTPDFSDMSRKAVQKLLVRRPGKNWEDLMINMQLVEVGATGAINAAGSLGDGPAPKTRRWLITSIYKQGTP